MQRNNISSGTNYEKQLGYSRVVRIGPHIAIASTAAINRLGEIQHIDDAYAQTTYILNKIQKVVAAAGANLHHILRTRLYLRNVDHWQDVGRAHRDFFGPIHPAITMIQVADLLIPESLLEIEAEAIVYDAPLEETSSEAGTE